MPRHPSFHLKIKIKQPYSTSLSLSLFIYLSIFLSLPIFISLLISLSLSLSLSLYLSHTHSLSLFIYISIFFSLSLCLSLSISLWLTEWMNEEHLEHARTFCLVWACSKHSSFNQSVSQSFSLGDFILIWHLNCSKKFKMDYPLIFLFWNIKRPLKLVALFTWLTNITIS